MGGSQKDIEPRVTISTVERWEQGINHDPRSEGIFNFMKNYDDSFNNGGLDLKSGGDGDLGEELMYLMDEYFAARDQDGGDANG